MSSALAGTTLSPTPEPLASLPRRGNARARETRALLFSLLFHACLLSLTFGSQGEGWPGLSLPSNWPRSAAGSEPPSETRCLYC